MIIYTILTLCAILLTGFIVYVLIQLSRTLKSINTLLEEMQKTIPSMLEKLDKTITNVSNEAERVEEVMKSVEEISGKVTATAEIVREFISSPLIKIASLSAGAKKAINTLLGRE